MTIDLMKHPVARQAPVAWCWACEEPVPKDRAHAALWDCKLLPLINGRQQIIACICNECVRRWAKEDAMQEAA